MSQANGPIPDEDLTPHFRWRWGEHGIYLAVSSFIGLFVLALHVLPLSSRRMINPGDFDFVQARYMSATDEPPAKEEPFRDPRLLRRSGNRVPVQPIRHAL
jgi:hypothetical protein